MDVVSGQVITSETDVDLPGLLPLTLRRAYASDYIGGRLYGPGWSSTLDQRIEIDADGIHFAGDDAQILHYPLPDSPGRAVLPTGGACRPLVWDQRGDTFRIEDPDSGWTHHFAGSGAPPWRIGEVRPLTEVSDRNGHRIEFLRDADGLPTEVRHSAGYRVAVDTAPGPEGEGVRAERLRLLDETVTGTTVVEYQYYPDGHLAAIVDSTGLPYVYEYDDQGRMTDWIDRNGYSYTYGYDQASGRVVRASGQDGVLAAEFAYDTAARTTAVTDSLGRTTVYQYDQDDRVTLTTDPAGHRVHTEWDRRGRPLSTTDQLGRTTRYTLDEQGDPVRIDHPDGTATEFGHNALRLPVQISLPGGAVWRYEYDERGNRLAVTDPCAATTRYEYDELGRATATVDAEGNVTRIETDPAGLVLSVTDPLGQTHRCERDGFGRVVAETDPLGATTRYGWTVEGRPLWRLLPDGGREEWVHDPEGGLLEHLDPAGHRTRYEVGSFGVRTAQIDAAGTRLEYRYDTELRMTAVTSPTGRTWQYAYDQAGNLAAETDYNDRTVRYEHDAAGQLVRRTNGAGQSVGYTWDAAGRVTGHHSDTGGSDFAYDEAGNLRQARNKEVLLGFGHDALGRLLTETANGLTTTSSYDLLGRRVERRTPGGTVTLWQHDANHQTTALQTSNVRLSFGYDAAGQELYRWLGDRLALTSSWDRLGRLTGRQVLAVDGTGASRNSRLLRERGWTYRGDGLPATQSDKGGIDRHFQLDPIGQVTAVQAGELSERYSYDAGGNLLHAATAGDPALDSAGPRTVDGMLLREAGRCRYEYDAQGRLTGSRRRTLSGKEKSWEFRWDAFDRLTDARNPAGEHWHYVYDPLGRRAAKQLLGPDGAVLAETRFCWDGEVLAEQGHHVTGQQTTTTTTWEYQPDTWTPVTQIERTRSDQAVIDEQFYAIVTDLAGAPTELLTAEGAVVWQRTASLWGLPLTSDATGPADCPLRFPGQYHDEETGLDYNLHRYYDPQTARFISPDPLGLTPAPNHYAYVTNPLDEIDPLGLAKRKGSGGGSNSGGNNNQKPTPPAPGSRAIPPRQPPPSSLPGFPGARRVPPKTPVQKGGGLRPRWEDKKHIYEWDSQHGEVEKYDKQGKHLGAYDTNGKQLKGPEAGRKCVK